MELNIQNILVVTSLILAIIFLVRKFRPKKQKGDVRIKIVAVVISPVQHQDTSLL